MFVIKAASFILPIPFFKKIVHNFWVLEDVENHKIVAELHGLATSRRTGKIVPIGFRKEHSLKAHHIVFCSDFAAKYGFELGTFKLPRHEMHIVYQGEDTLERWFNAVKAIEIINALDLDYPRGGFKLPFESTVNSNTIYHTLADIMNIKMHCFPNCIQLGSNKTLYQQIEKSINDSHNLKGVIT